MSILNESKERSTNKGIHDSDNSNEAIYGKEPFNPLAEEPEYLTGKQLAGKLNVSIKAVVKWTAAHRLPGAYKIGRVWRYQWREIEKKLLSGSLLFDKR